MSKPVFGKRGRRGIAIVVVGALLIGWLLGLPGWWARQSAVKAFSRRDYVVAWDWIQWASRLDQDNPETEFLIARLERKRGHLDQVRRHIQRAAALGLDPDRVHREELLAIAQTGDLASIVSELDQLLINHSEDGAEICDAYVNGLLINGQLAAADSLIQQWQQAFPDDPQPDFLLGRIAEFDHNPPQAEAHYKNSMTKNPRHFVTANALGRVLGELNRWDEAFKAYEVCLAFPNPAPAKLGMARCLANLGREEEARHLLRSLVEMPKDKMNEALKQIGEQTESDLFSFELGSLEAKCGHAEDAVQLLTRAVEQNSRHREARYQLARALSTLGRTDEAKVHFDWYQETQESVVEIDRLHDQVKRNPQDLDARCQLGKLYLKIGSKNVGTFWLKSVLAQDPTHADAQAALAK